MGLFRLIRFIWANKVYSKQFLRCSGNSWQEEYFNENVSKNNLTTSMKMYKKNILNENVFQELPHFGQKMAKAPCKPIWSTHIYILPTASYFYPTSILLYPIALAGCRGTTDEFAPIPFHLVLFSPALTHSCPLFDIVFPPLPLSPLHLFPFTVPCRIVFAIPEDLETWPNHQSFCFLTRVRSYS